MLPQQRTKQAIYVQPPLMHPKTELLITTLATDQRFIKFGKTTTGYWINFTIRIAAPKKHSVILGDTKKGSFAIRVAE